MAVCWLQIMTTSQGIERGPLSCSGTNSCPNRTPLVCLTMSPLGVTYRSSYDRGLCEPAKLTLPATLESLANFSCLSSFLWIVIWTRPHDGGFTLPPVPSVQNVQRDSTLARSSAALCVPDCHRERRRLFRPAPVYIQGRLLHSLLHRPCQPARRYARRFRGKKEVTKTLLTFW